MIKENINEHESIKALEYWKRMLVGEYERIVTCTRAYSTKYQEREDALELIKNRIAEIEQSIEVIKTQIIPIQYGQYIGKSMFGNGPKIG